MDLCAVFEFICALWLGGVGLLASPATYVGFCFYWEVQQAHRALKLTTIAVVLGGVEPHMDLCGVFEFICLFWLGGVGLRASPATYGSCFWLGRPTSPSSIEINHHRRLCVGVWNPILICVVFSSSFAYSGWEVLGFVPHPQPTLDLIFVGKPNKPTGH